MQRDYGDGDGIISQVRSNGNEGKKRIKSRGEGNAKKIKGGSQVARLPFRKRTLHFTVHDQGCF